MKQVMLSIEKWQHIPESADWAVKRNSKYADRSLNKIEKSLALLQFRSAAIKPRINHLFEPGSS